MSDLLEKMEQLTWYVRRAAAHGVLPEWRPADADLVDGARAEIERLRKLFAMDGKQHAQHIKGRMESWVCEREALVGEIERLRALARAALEDKP